MERMTCAAAEQMLTDWAFSFIETCGVRCTAVRISYTKVITAANCVEYQDGPFARFVVSTAGLR